MVLKRPMPCLIRWQNEECFSIPYGSNGVEAWVADCVFLEPNVSVSPTDRMVLKPVSMSRMVPMDHSFSIPYGSNGVEAEITAALSPRFALFQYPLRIEWC